MTEPETLTAEERARLIAASAPLSILGYDIATESAIAKLLRLYDAALADLATMNQNYDTLQEQHESALSRIAEQEASIKATAETDAELSRAHAAVYADREALRERIAELESHYENFRKELREEIVCYRDRDHSDRIAELERELAASRVMLRMANESTIREARLVVELRAELGRRS